MLVVLSIHLIYFIILSFILFYSNILFQILVYNYGLFHFFLFFFLVSFATSPFYLYCVIMHFGMALYHQQLCFIYIIHPYAFVPIMCRKVRHKMPCGHGRISGNVDKAADRRSRFMFNRSPAQNSNQYCSKVISIYLYFLF